MQICWGWDLMRGGAGSYWAAIALGLLVGADLGASLGSARAQQACLTAPNAPAPAGSHWYYRTDPASGHKCWYVRERDQAGAPVPGRQAVAPAPVKPGRKTTPVLAAPDPSAWMDPVEQPNSTTVDWPAPTPVPSPAGEINGQPSNNPAPPPAVAPSPVRAIDSPPPKLVKPDSPANSSLATPSANAVPASAGPPVRVTTADKPAVFQRRAAAAIGVAGLLGLVLAGLFLRRIITKTMGGRRAIKLARMEPRLVDSGNVMPPLPTRLRQSPSLVPGQHETNARINEIEESLRQFARRLRQRRSRPAGVFARMGAWVRS